MAVAVDRYDLLLVGLVVVGALVFAATPPEPTYDLDASLALADDPSPVRDFDTFDDTEREQFRDALEGTTGSMYEPPEIESGYVRYRDRIYNVEVRVAESSAFSMLMPPAGVGLALLGLGGIGGRRLWRQIR